MSGLALFDIDGTLTASNDIDTDCLVRALRDEYEITGIDTDWSHYEHTSDRGILNEVLRKAWQREPSEEELWRHRRRFLELLRQRSGEIMPVEGAGAFLEFVRAAGWRVGIITGAWSASGRLKLEAAGLNTSNVPLVSCDRFAARAEILRCAISEPGRDAVVLFGDAIWDLRSAEETGIGFIGINSGDAAQRLIEAGAQSVFPHYGDRERILAAMLRSAR